MTLYVWQQIVAIVFRSQRHTGAARATGIGASGGGAGMVKVAGLTGESLRRINVGEKAYVITYATHGVWYPTAIPVTAIRIECVAICNPLITTNGST